MTTSLRQVCLSASLITLAGFAPVLAAQEKAQATSLLPADPLFTVHIDGPAALRAAFLPTNLGKMFAGPEWNDMIAPVKEMMEGLKQQAGDEVTFDVSAFEKAIYGYSGRITAGFHLLEDNIDFNAPEPPDFAVTVTMSPDGKTDLADFCKQAGAFMKDKMGDFIGDTEVSGKNLTYVLDDDSDEPGISAPFMHNGHAVLLVTRNFKKAAGAVLADDAKRYQPESRFATASIGVSVNTERLFDLLTKGMSAQLGPMWDGMGLAIYKGTGFSSLRSFDVTYRAKGPAVLSEMIVNFNDKDRGLMGALFPTQAGRSKLIDFLPRQAMAASAMHMDLKHVYKTVKKVFAEMGDDAPMAFEDLEEQFKEMYGLRLFEDLIGLFGQNIMSVQMETEEFDASSPLGSVDGLSLGFEISDGQKLAKSIDTMLRKDGLHAGRKKDDYKGFTVYNMNIAMMLDLHYAVSDNLLVIGLGTTGGDAVRATLDEAKNRAAGEEIEKFQTDVASRLKMARGGYQGLGWADMERQMEAIGMQFDALAGQLPPEMDVVGDMLEKLPALMKNYKVKHQVAVMRAEGNRWVYENIW